jgi:hypothetical protein
MSDIELYQSVLLKLGQLPAKELADLDAYLSQRIRQRRVRHKPKNGSSNVSKSAGAWKDWDDKEFEDFLRITREAREEMFADREFQL